MNNHTRHRNVQGGASRAAVLGAGDGLITNLSLILGVAGASTDASAVRLAGVAGLLAGAFSMAAGELVSVRAQDEPVQRELQVERQELSEHPERRELAAMYRAKGVSPDDAETVARILSRYEQVAFDIHARLELGVDPAAGGSAVQASVASFLSFAVGAFLPLIFGCSSGGPKRSSSRSASAQPLLRCSAQRSGHSRVEECSELRSDSSYPQSWRLGSHSQSAGCEG